MAVIQDSASFEAIDAYIEGQMRRLAIPGASLAIVEGDKIERRILFRILELRLEATTEHSGSGDRIYVREFAYGFTQSGIAYRFGMKLKDEGIENGRGGYELIDAGYGPKRARGRPWPLPAPVKCYGFPDQVNATYQNAGFLNDLVLAFEQMFQGIYYLGPLREYAHRTYAWGGEQPQDGERRGERAVHALLAGRARGIKLSRGRGKTRQAIDERIAQWLSELGLIDSFSLRQSLKTARSTRCVYGVLHSPPKSRLRRLY